MSQINQYANSVTAINDNDYLDVDKYISLGVYQSNKILGSDLKAQFGSNFATSNLTFTDNRTHDLDSKTLLLGKGKDYTFEAAVVAPSIGKASFNFKGFGNTSSDEVIRVRNGNNEDLLKINGDGTMRIGAPSPFTFDKSLNVFNDGRIFLAHRSGNFIELNPSGQNRFVFNENGLKLETTYQEFSVAMTSASWFLKQGNSFFGSIVAPNGATKNTFIENGVLPSTFTTDFCSFTGTKNATNKTVFSILNEDNRTVKVYQHVNSNLGLTANSGDANTDLLINALKDLVLTLGLGATV